MGRLKNIFVSYLAVFLMVVLGCEIGGQLFYKESGFSIVSLVVYPLWAVPHYLVAGYVSFLRGRK